jgi:hypothetical protein
MSRRQTADALRLILDEQFGWLADSAEAYDRGSEAEAKRIAVVIRTLVHDTAASRSLLRQLELKHSLSFVARNFKFKPWNFFPVFHGLVGIVIDPYQGPAFVPHYDRVSPRLLSFEEWWSEPVLGRGGQRLFSRQKLVLTLANKEGGAHVDPELEEVYASLARDSEFGLRVSAGGHDREWRQNPFLPSVRQIGHELLQTLQAVSELANKQCPTGETALKRVKGWLHEKARPEREVLAYHAAGHQLIASGLGWWLGEASIESRQESEQPGRSSRAHANSSPHVPHEQCPIEGAMVDLAGFAAETWVNAKADPAVSSHTSFNHAADLLGFPRLENADETRDKYFHKLLGYLDEMLRERWSILEDLVSALLTSGTQSGEQAATIIGLGLVRLGEGRGFALKRGRSNSGYVVLVYPDDHPQAGNVMGLQLAVDYPSMAEDDAPAVRARAAALAPGQ